MKVMDCASADEEDVRRMMGIWLVSGYNLLLECNECGETFEPP